jgi:hypothetical protein
MRSLKPLPPNSSLAAATAAAARMRLHRQRRRHGLRCITVQMRNSEVDAMVRFGWLDPDARIGASGSRGKASLGIDRDPLRIRASVRLGAN